MKPKRTTNILKDMQVLVVAKYADKDKDAKDDQEFWKIGKIELCHKMRSKQRMPKTTQYDKYMKVFVVLRDEDNAKDVKDDRSSEMYKSLGCSER